MYYFFVKRSSFSRVILILVLGYAIFDNIVMLLSLYLLLPDKFKINNITIFLTSIQYLFNCYTLPVKTSKLSLMILLFYFCPSLFCNDIIEILICQEREEEEEDWSESGSGLQMRCILGCTTQSQNFLGLPLI